ncbi:MAG: GNAT family N-acetyltransferase [Clostridia bacterium]|nr:GNAT family N-acetyltransferase [Clostridia bacterium]
MVEYRKGRAEDAADILDFINYVFSQAHYPHDFRKFNPRMYASDYPFWEDHYVAVENGKIRGTLSVTRTERERAGVKLVCGHVGQVSVHPYARGEGHMKKLMAMADEDMRTGGFDLAELNGLRQRYEYFGYTQGDCRLRARITPTNVRHALGNRAEELMHGLTARVRDDNTAWEKRWDILDAEGRRLAVAGPGTLETEALDRLPALCGVFFRSSGEKEMTVSAALYDTARVRALTAFCEDVQLSTGMQYKIYRFDRVLQAALALKANSGLLRDGELAVEIDGLPLRLCVRGGHAEVVPGRAGEGLPLTAMQAQEFFFATAAPLLHPEAPAGWLPVSL